MIIIEDIKQSLGGLIVRDDLFPYFYGGNKARKALEYEKELKHGHYNAVVTTGGIQSNHCRVVALLAAKNGWKCHIVYHGSEDRFYKEKGNALLVRKTNATYEFVNADGISNSMNNAMLRYEAEGYMPYYITGGGHDMAGGIAYINAVKDLIRNPIIRKKIPDRIFLASGTGSTQAGIIVGLELCGHSDIEVIGISIARNKDRATQVTTEFLQTLSKNYGINKNLSDKVKIIDDYLMGGYECFSLEAQLWIETIVKKAGIVFDTTYSGKALWGMSHFIENDNLKNQNNLFWHTGGLLNVLS